MAQDQHNRPACAQFSMDKIQIFRLNSCRHLFQRHPGELDAAQEIRAQPLKMAKHKATQFPRRFFVSKCDCNVALCQAWIFSGNDPGTKAEKFSKNEENRHW